MLVKKKIKRKKRKRQLHLMLNKLLLNKLNRIIINVHVVVVVVKEFKKYK